MYILSDEVMANIVGGTITEINSNEQITVLARDEPVLCNILGSTRTVFLTKSGVLGFSDFGSGTTGYEQICPEGGTMSNIVVIPSVALEKLL